MKIVHVGNHTFPCKGGIEEVIWKSAQYQSLQGNEVKIIVFDSCNKGNKLPEHEKKERVEIIRMPSINLGFYKMPFPKKLLPLLKDADIIHIHGFGGWLDTIALNRSKLNGKIILNTHGGFFHTSQRKLLKQFYLKIWLPYISGKLDYVIYDSHSDFEKLHAHMKTDYSIIPNGVDTHPFETIPLTKRNRHELVFLGRISQNKRVDHLINAMGVAIQTIPDLHLHILGKDWEGLQPKLMELARTKGISENIHFHGEVEESKINSHFRKAGYFISASEYEGFGMSVIEAMAAGLVPLLNSIPTFVEFAGEKKERGFIIDFSNEKNAGNEIAKTVSMPEKSFLVLQKKARAHAKRFSLPSIMEQNLQLYTKLCTTTRSATKS